MATTQNYPIRSLSQLEKALKYIRDEKKTVENGISLVTGIHCTPETSFNEFMYYKKIFNKNTKRTGFHIKQNFKPGEIDGKTAHEIGVKLARKHLKEYQCVVATHIDKKHIHNHIVFNSVSIEDGKQYINSNKDYYLLRNQSDELCREYNLSIVEPKNKGKKYKEWMESLRGNSWKGEIKNDIDILIKKFNTFDEIKNELKRMGYLIKEGKYISYKSKKGKRFVRGKTLGTDYTKKGIEIRLSFKSMGLNIFKHNINFSTKNKYNLKFIKKKIYKPKSLFALTIIIALNKLRSIKAENIKFGREQVIENLTKQLNLVNDNKINNINDFKKCVELTNCKFFDVQKERRDIDIRKSNLEENIENIENFEKYVGTENFMSNVIFKNAREFLIKNGIKDTGEKDKMKQQLEQVRSIKSNLDKECDLLLEKRYLLNELENTIIKIKNKESPFKINKNKSKER